MRVTSVKWTPRVNELTVACLACHITFEHPTNRNAVRCPRCGRHRRITKLREDFVFQGAFKPPGNWRKM